MHITESLPFFMSRVLGGTRGLAVGRVCKDSAHRAGSTCPVAAWDTRPALRVFEGQSHLIFRGSLGIHKQMHAYFYFPFCLFKQMTESYTFPCYFSLNNNEGLLHISTVASFSFCGYKIFCCMDFCNHSLVIVFQPFALSSNAACIFGICKGISGIHSHKWNSWVKG